MLHLRATIIHLLIIVGPHRTIRLKQIAKAIIFTKNRIGKSSQKLKLLFEDF